MKERPFRKRDLERKIPNNNWLPERIFTSVGDHAQYGYEIAPVKGTYTILFLLFRQIFLINLDSAQGL